MTIPRNICTWTGTTDGVWNRSGNWSGETVPADVDGAQIDDVVIPITTNRPTTGPSSAITIQNITIETDAAVAAPGLLGTNGANLKISGVGTITDVGATAATSGGTVIGSSSSRVILLAGATLVSTIQPPNKGSTATRSLYVDVNAGATHTILCRPLTGANYNNFVEALPSGVVIAGTVNYGDPTFVRTSAEAFSGTPACTVQAGYVWGIAVGNRGAWNFINSAAASGTVIVYVGAAMNITSTITVPTAFSVRAPFLFYYALASTAYIQEAITMNAYAPVTVANMDIAAPGSVAIVSHGYAVSTPDSTGVTVTGAVANASLTRRR